MYVYTYVYGYMGVVQNYGTPKLPLHCPFANLSRPYAPQQNRDREYDHVFVCIFRKNTQEDCIKNITSYRNWKHMSLLQSTELMALGKSVFLWGLLTPGHWFCTHSLKNFWTCDIAEWTRPFWVRAGLGRIRLSRTFRGPFANLSPLSRLNNTISENNVYARVAFIICVHQGANANLRTWDNTKLKPVRIHRQRKADVYISLYIYLSKLYRYNIQSQPCKENCQAWIL